MKKNFHIYIVMMMAISLTGYAGVKNIAHRGGSFLAPENTAAAWQSAIQLNADFIELDIQLSSDDSMMIMHDPNVDRTTNGTGFVSTMTYEQLRTLDAGSKFSPAFAGEKIPTFSEALEIAKNSPNNIGIVAEIKTSDATAVTKTVAMIQAYGMQSRVVVSSFSLSQITEVKSLDSTIAVQLFASASYEIIDQIRAIKGEWIGSNTSSKELIDYAHMQWMSFNIWTINGASQMKSYIDLGVDGITTDDPKTLNALADTTNPSDVTLLSATPVETKITLQWQPASDDESGVTGYTIYRGENPSPVTLYATVDDTTQFVDETFSESKTFYYRVKAKNLAGLLSKNFSNELSATTAPDVVKPTVSYVTSRGDSSTIVIEFSERIDSTTASTITNYTLDKSAQVLKATIALDLTTVLLTTTPLKDSVYTLTVKNIKDRALTPNVLSTSTNTFAHVNLSAHTVAYYTLDELSTQDATILVLDASANGNNGIVYSGAKISEGYVGNALGFDGVDDFVQFTSSPSFDINGSAVSVSVWARLAYLPADMPTSFGPLFDSETDQYVLYEDKGSNELRFKVSTSVSAERPGIPAADLKANEWIHVVGVYDGSAAKIYLNGVLKDTHPITGTVKTGQAATLGKSGTSYFSGRMDNILVLNTALTDSEIVDIYTNTKTEPLTSTGVQKNISTSIPSEFLLSQNYPNPFNPTTTISFAVPLQSNVKIAIYDIVGREVEVLVNGNFVQGNYSVSLNGSTLASGVYLYRMTSQPLQGGHQLFTSTKKFLLMK